jgi:hypothetical protein
MRLKHARAILNYHLPPFIPLARIIVRAFSFGWANGHPHAIRIPTGLLPRAACRASWSLLVLGLAGHAHSARIYVTCKPHRPPICLALFEPVACQPHNGEEKVRVSCVDKVGLTITISARSASLGTVFGLALLASCCCTTLRRDRQQRYD